MWVRTYWMLAKCAIPAGAVVAAMAPAPHRMAHEGSNNEEDGGDDNGGDDNDDE